MKKILSAVLASAMVLSMGVVAFADDNAVVAGAHEAPVKISSYALSLADTDGYAYGDTILFALTGDSGNLFQEEILISNEDAVRSLRLTSKWEMGRELVESISLVKKKVKTTFNYKTGEFEKIANGSDYFYFVAVELKANPTTTDLEDLVGTITLKKSENTIDDVVYPAVDVDIDVNVEIEHDNATKFVVTEDPQIFEFNDGDIEQWFDFDAHSSYDYFIVDTCDQDDLVLEVDADYDADIAAQFSKANLHFFNGNYATFNRVGTLYLHDCGALTANYVYAISKDGEVEEIAYTYDEYEDAFVINTRTLGRYVLSDVKLDLEVEDEVTVTPEADKSNPETGAVA